MRRLLSSIAIGSLLFVALGSAPAAASTSFEFLFSASHIDNDDHLFLNLAIGDYGYSRAEIEPVLPGIHAVEADLPVILFLARKSGSSVAFVAGLRADGFGWSVVFGKVGVSVGVLLGGFERDPGPPYGKAWGHWKNKRNAVILSDAEIVDLVHIHVGSRLAGVPAHEMVHARANGKTIVTIVADRKGRPHARKPGKASGPGKGNGKGARKGN